MELFLKFIESILTLSNNSLSSVSAEHSQAIITPAEIEHSGRVCVCKSTCQGFLAVEVYLDEGLGCGDGGGSALVLWWRTGGGG